MDCIFCKIAAGDIPSDIVHETDKLVVIKDLNPQSPTHLLLIPKKHYRSILDCDDKDLMAELFTVARDVAGDIGISEGGFRLVVNTNSEGGQTVFHLHMHLMGGKTLKGEMG